HPAGTYNPLRPRPAPFCCLENNNSAGSAVRLSPLSWEKNLLFPGFSGASPPNCSPISDVPTPGLFARRGWRHRAAAAPARPPPRPPPPPGGGAARRGVGVGTARRRGAPPPVGAPRPPAPPPAPPAPPPGAGRARPPPPRPSPASGGGSDMAGDVRGTAQTSSALPSVASRAPSGNAAGPAGPAARRDMRRAVSVPLAPRPSVAPPGD